MMPAPKTPICACRTVSCSAGSRWHLDSTKPFRPSQRQATPRPAAKRSRTHTHARACAHTSEATYATTKGDITGKLKEQSVSPRGQPFGIHQNEGKRRQNGHVYSLSYSVGQLRSPDGRTDQDFVLGEDAEDGVCERVGDDGQAVHAVRDQLPNRLEQTLLKTIDARPREGEWHAPMAWHSAAEAGKFARCVMCVNASRQEHAEGGVLPYEKTNGYVSMHARTDPRTE